MVFGVFAAQKAALGCQGEPRVALGPACRADAEFSGIHLGSVSAGKMIASALNLRTAFDIKIGGTASGADSWAYSQNRRAEYLRSISIYGPDH
jgi:hypothetical protein